MQVENLGKTHRVTLWFDESEFNELEKLQEMTGKSKPDLFYQLFKQRMFLVMFDWCYIPATDFKFLLDTLTPDQLLDYSHLLAKQMCEIESEAYFDHYMDVIAKWSKFNHAQWHFDKIEQTIHWNHPYGKNFSQSFYDALSILADTENKMFVWSNIGENTLMAKLMDIPATDKMSIEKTN